MELVTILAFLLAGILFVWLSRRTRSSNVGAPRTLPGPRRDWFVGNLFDIPMNHMWLAFTELSKKHGEIIGLQALGSSIVVLNTLESVNALLDKKGSIYSNRPVYTMAGELVGIDGSMPMLQYGSAWRNQRKLTHLAFNTQAVKQYLPNQEEVAVTYLQTLLDRPDEFMSELRLAAGRIIMTITYALPLHSYEDDYVAEAEAVLKFVERAVLPGSYLVDFIPALKYVPNIFGLVSFQTEAKKYYRIHEQMQRGPFEHVKRDLAAGKHSPSFTADLLTRDDTGLDAEKEESIMATASALYGAGGETTYAAVLTFILAMALFPEKQQKAQDEIDRVVGSERLPNADDGPSLPYVAALINETMRWHPVTPIGIPHTSTQEDYYKGYIIPKGSLVMPNIWAISHDESTHESPEDFIPERFLNESENSKTPLDPHSYFFGFGRRVCPGRYLASNSLYIFVTFMLAAFRIRKPLDSQGNEIPIKPVYTGGVVSRPEPFECRFIPRSAKVVELIRNSRKASSG